MSSKFSYYLQRSAKVFLQYSILVCVLCLIVNCASSTVSSTRSNDAIAQVLKGSEPTKTVFPLSSDSKKIQSNSEIENMTLDEVIRIEEPNTQNLYDNSRYDFPITINDRVEGWIDYFAGRGRSHMERYLGRSSRYMPVMKQIFKKAGLPEDLVYLALIESGFNLRAKSRAKAVGPWQFMKATGKRYGLRVDAWVDERRDPLKSTEAAANYLKDLYLMFESWYLAASAYNAGEYKVLRAIEETKTNNYWRICETKALRRETKDYVPKLIAAAIIAKNPAKYGFQEIAYQEPLEFEVTSVQSLVKLKDIARMIDVQEDDILDLNPAFARGVIPKDGESYEIRVPPGTKVLVERSMASYKGKLETNEIPLEIKVKSGDTLKSLAKKYKVSAKELGNVNHLSTREKLVVGSLVLIPRYSPSFVADTRYEKPSKEKEVKRSTSSTPTTPDIKNDDFVTHIVKSGDSLWSISEQYDVTVQSIFRWNNLKRSRIFPGKKLKIKVTKTKSETPQTKS